MHEANAAGTQSRSPLLRTDYLLHNSMIGLIDRLSPGKIRKLSSHLGPAEPPITEQNEWDVI